MNFVSVIFALTLWYAWSAEESCSSSGSLTEALVLDGDGAQLALLQTAGLPFGGVQPPFNNTHMNDGFVRAGFPARSDKQALYWLHVSKCGTSFANVFLHTPLTCPYVPQDFIWEMGSPQKGMAEDLVEYCPKIILTSSGHFGAHDGFGSLRGKVGGSAVNMLRDPEQRILSAYANHQHDWPLMTPARSELEFAELNAGCQVRMLIHSDPSEFPRGSVACMHDLPTEADVAEAKATLHSDFSFVGLLEEYDLSVCLFRVMFGGACQPSMFYNVHLAGDSGKVTQNTTATRYDTSVLQGFEDWADRALYEDGSEIFAQNLQQYDVTLASCQPCFEADSW
mmetsp:Transcript_63693/g.168660  ORF Transcript_63693/g.168660 Transcript_63693/m.168660 type:complete len:338 (-) Transcript_63693:74-1087(-)